jgi:hypothetical protein
MSRCVNTLATMFRTKKYRTATFIGNWALCPQRKLIRGFETYTRDFTSAEGVRIHPENLTSRSTSD